MTLATTTWGDPTATQRALLVHGLTSGAGTWWQLGEALANDGWHVTGVDLRGNGRSAEAASYRLTEYAADLPGSGWDLVVGHSLGTPIAVIAASEPGFARRVVLVDPVLEVDEAMAAELLADELSELELTADQLRTIRPNWSERDITEKLATLNPRRAAMVEATIRDNPDWHVTAALSALPVPVLILSGDPAVYSMLPVELADAVVATNPLVTYIVVPGTGHSPHRDAPDQSIALLREWLTSAGEPQP